MGHALVLNATYEPLCVVPARRALLLVLMRKAISVEDSDLVLHSSSIQLRAPAVVRLIRYVRIPYRGPVPLTRRAVFARDGGRCVYCGVPATSIDHVVPRSRGGEHVWENVVAACRPCNTAKRDRLLSETSMTLRRRPTAPRALTWISVAVGSVPTHWEPYLQPALSA